jgi:(E)-4-hydroxy-3-methylbut-2-enyl-diphosphate synthase
LVPSALRCIERIRNMGFDDLVVSVKSSSALDTVRIGRSLAYTTDCPLHIGVTEAGIGGAALVKSAVGIGALLADGIGDTIRVSITGDPVQEVHAARDILAALGQLPGAVNVISCPTCGRCKVDLAQVAQEVSDVLRETPRKAGRALDVAVMGCAVNGPGEASQADVGVAFGGDGAVLFEKGAVVGKLRTEEVVPALVAAVREGR